MYVSNVLNLKLRTFETYISLSLLKTEIYCHFAVSPFRVLITPLLSSLKNKIIV